MVSLQREWVGVKTVAFGMGFSDGSTYIPFMYTSLTTSRRDMTIKLYQVKRQSYTHACRLKSLPATRKHREQCVDAKDIQKYLNVSCDITTQRLVS